MALSGLGRARIVGTRMAGLGAAVGRIEPHSKIAVQISPRSPSMRIDGTPRWELEPDVARLVRWDVATVTTRLSPRPSKSSNSNSPQRAEPVRNCGKVRACCNDARSDRSQFLDAAVLCRQLLGSRQMNRSLRRSAKKSGHRPSPVPTKPPSAWHMTAPSDR